MNRTSVVVVPELTFARLSRVLSELGWRVENQSSSPIVPGEPEWAVFSYGPSGGAIHYTFNPVVALRVLNHRDADEPAWREATEQLPRLDVTRLRKLLGSEEKRDILLGLYAAGELQETRVVDLVAALCEHPDARVSSSAVRCRDQLLAAAIAEVRTLASDPGRLFSLIRVVEWRRQTLRWFARDYSKSDPSIDRVLCMALADDDAEVRMTAVLTAAKLNARRVLECLRQTRVPESTRDGADERQRLFYREVWRAAVRYLSTGNAKDAFLATLDGSLRVKDDPTLLLHSLVTPFTAGPKPDRLPAGIEEHKGRYRLTGSHVPLRWIPPVPHWLGEDRVRDPQNPVRQIHPQVGFFIWEQSAEDLHDYTEASRLCRQLAVTLPTPDQWEMAARGPDGRRYPWGNALMSDWRRHSSPWGLRGMLGNAYEWTRSLNGQHVVCGGPDPAPCAKRNFARPEDRATLRPVIEIGCPR
jgi:hypothetical protein